MDEATFDIVVAGSKNDQGGIDILMIEGEAPDNTWPLLAAGEGATAPTEEVVAQGLERAKEVIAEVIEFQEEFLAAVGVKPSDFEPHPLYQLDLWEALESFAKDRVRTALVPDRKERESNMSALKVEAKAHLAEVLGEDVFAQRAQEFSPAWKALEKKVMRERVISDGVRLDGRGAKDIRPLSAHVGLLPRAHGSSLFERGDTQALNVTTLGMLRMNQMIDTLDLETRSDTSTTTTSRRSRRVRRVASARPAAGRSATGRSRSARSSRWSPRRRSSRTRCDWCLMSWPPTARHRWRACVRRRSR